MIKMDADQFRQVVGQLAPQVKDGAPPFRNCYLFSSLLSADLRSRGIPAIPYQDYYHLVTSQGETSGHTVALAKVNPILWGAVDLTSEIIPGIPPDMVWTGRSLVELGQAVDASLPGYGLNMVARMTEAAFQQIVSSLSINGGMMDGELLISLGLY